MIRTGAILAAMLATLAGALPAVGNDDDPFDPTGETVVVYLESVPEGAGIEFKGNRSKYETNSYVSFELDYLRTIRIVLDGYEPCTATQDRLPRDPKTGDLVFTCKLRRIENRPIGEWLLPDIVGPVGPLEDNAVEDE